MNALIASLERQAKYYGRQDQMKDMQPTGGGASSPSSPHVESYNDSSKNASVSSTVSYNYEASPNYSVEQRNQLPLHSQPTYHPSANVYNPAITYPMTMHMPVPFVKQQEESQHQQSICDGYVSNAQNPAMVNSSRTEVSTTSYVPNTNNIFPLLDSAAQQGSNHQMLHTPDEIVTSSPHLNETPRFPHTK
ncbi:hypothetical protein BC943DRAFT_356202 [Umbelopsis sp. AD052]|nr:hypothetical protein BC943DRAFT_356202 [Umbelopsis sp. AD052]